MRLVLCKHCINLGGRSYMYGLTNTQRHGMLAASLQVTPCMYYVLLLLKSLV
jgi:hypothetical protein